MEKVFAKLSLSSTNRVTPRWLGLVCQGHLSPWLYPNRSHSSRGKSRAELSNSASPAVQGAQRVTSRKDPEADMRKVWFSFWLPFRTTKTQKNHKSAEGPLGRPLDSWSLLRPQKWREALDFRGLRGTPEASGSLCVQLVFRWFRSLSA